MKPQQELERNVRLVSQCVARLPHAEKHKALKECWNKRHGLDLVELSRIPGVIPPNCKTLQNAVIPEKPDGLKHFDFRSIFKKKPHKPDNQYMKFLISLRTPLPSKVFRAKPVYIPPGQGSVPGDSPWKLKKNSRKASPSKTHRKSARKNTQSRNPATHPGEEIHKLLPRLLQRFPAGLWVQELEEIVKRMQGRGLEKISLDLGYQDTESLLLQIPDIKVWTPEKGVRSRVTYQKDSGGRLKSSVPPNKRPEGTQHAPEILRMIRQSLCKTSGLQIKKLKEALWIQHGVDLQKVCQDLGYKDTLDFLQEAPNLQLSDPTKKNKCVVRIKKGAKGQSITKTPQPSSTRPASFSDQPRNKPQDTGIQGVAPTFTPQLQNVPPDSSPKTSINRTPATVTSALSYATVAKFGHTLSFRQKLHEVNLEDVNHDAVRFQPEAPNIRLSETAKSSKWLVGTEKDKHFQPISPFPSLSEHAFFPDQPGSELRDTNLQTLAMAHPFQASSATPFKPHVASELPNTISTPLFEGLLTLVYQILHKMNGLQIKKLKQVLSVQHKVDLETVSRYLGYENALSFLQKAPCIQLSNPSRKKNYVVSFIKDLKKEQGHVLSHQVVSSTSLSPDQPEGQTVKENQRSYPITQFLKPMPPASCQEKPSEYEFFEKHQKYLPGANSLSSQWPTQCLDSQRLPLYRAPMVQLPPMLVSVSPPISSPIIPLVRPLCGPHFLSEPLTCPSLITKALPLPRSIPNQQLVPISAPITGIKVRNSFPVSSPGLQTLPWLLEPTVCLLGKSLKTGLASPPASPAVITTYLEMQNTKEPSEHSSSGAPTRNSSTGCKEKPGLMHSSFSLSMSTSAPEHSLRKPQETHTKTPDPWIPPKPTAPPLDLKTTPGLDKIGKLLSLPQFASGLRVEKLSEILKKDCEIDLEKLRKDLGCKDIIHFLQRIPNITLSDPNKWSKCIVKIQKAFQIRPGASSQNQNPVGPTPSSPLPTKKPPTECRKNSALTWTPNPASPGMTQNTTLCPLEVNRISALPQGSSQCRNIHHDPILKEEVVLALLQQPQGVNFGQFAGVFHQTHGYQLKLSRHGYKSLQSLLDDMMDLVEVVRKGTPDPLIRCRFPSRHRLVEIFPD